MRVATELSEQTEGAGNALQVDVETVEGEFAPGWFCHHRLLPSDLVPPVCDVLEREVS
jgi:hypothetical protein